MRKDISLSLKIIIGYSAFVCLYAYALAACTENQSKQVEEIVPAVDSVIIESNKHLDTANIVHVKSDSVVHKNVEKKVREIRYLYKIINVFKKEREQLQTVTQTEKII